MKKPPLSDELRLAKWWAQVSQDEEPDLTPWGKLADDPLFRQHWPALCDKAWSTGGLTRLGGALRVYLDHPNPPLLRPTLLLEVVDTIAQHHATSRSARKGFRDGQDWLLVRALACAPEPQALPFSFWKQWLLIGGASGLSGMLRWKRTDAEVERLWGVPWFQASWKAATALPEQCLALAKALGESRAVGISEPWKKLAQDLFSRLPLEWAPMCKEQLHQASVERFLEKDVDLARACMGFVVLCDVFGEDDLDASAAWQGWWAGQLEKEPSSLHCTVLLHVTEKRDGRIPAARWSPNMGQAWGHYLGTIHTAGPSKTSVGMAILIHAWIMNRPSDWLPGASEAFTAAFWQACSHAEHVWETSDPQWRESEAVGRAWSQWKHRRLEGRVEEAPSFQRLSKRL